MQIHFWVLLFIALAMGLSVAGGKLTPMAAAVGGVLAVCIYAGAGYTGILLLGTFFMAGVGATSWQRNVKEKIGVAEKDKGRRRPGQVVANAGVAALLGIGVALLPTFAVPLQLMLAAAFAAAAADTLSSELGTVYGKQFYNILTFKKDTKGLDGVVSVEGLLIGVLGSALIGLVYITGFGRTPHFVWIVIAGTIGNLSDSILGAALERKGFIKNDAVNFLNTLIGALVALALYSIP